MLNGCVHTTVYTSNKHENRIYDWTQIQSMLFNISINTPPTDAWVMPGPPECGTRGLSWIATKSNAELKTIRTTIKKVAKSINIVDNTSGSTDWDATIHIRRGDKLLNGWNTKKSLDIISKHAISFIKSQGLTKNYVCSDDPVYGEKFSKKIGASFIKNSSVYYDLSQMLKSKIIVRGGSFSQLSLLGAVLSEKPLIRFSKKFKVINIDNTWSSAGLVTIKTM